jgi:hypothetical protein
MLVRVWAIGLMACVWMTGAAVADETGATISIAGTHGTHRESGEVVTAPLVPAPILRITHKHRQYELLVEALPPIGPIGVANNGLGMQNVSLSYGDASLRYWNRAGTLAVGIGETLYNQSTQYLLGESNYFRNTVIDASRVAGVRYEFVGRIPAAHGDFTEAFVSVNPRLHGRLSWTRQLTITNLRTGQPITVPPYTTPSVYELGSEVGAGVRYVHRSGPNEISVGVRYLNYVARFADGSVNDFADANSFILPYISFARYFAH